MLDEPLISFWFDDALTGVHRHAAPILDQYGVTGGVAVCSAFMQRSELFWRFKLGYLQSIDGMRFVRSRLKPLGFRFGQSVRTFTITHFSDDVLAVIDELYERFTTPAQRADAYRMFLQPDDVADLQARGWEVSNHTARHYPVGAPLVWTGCATSSKSASRCWSRSSARRAIGCFHSTLKAPPKSQSAHARVEETDIWCWWEIGTTLRRRASTGVLHRISAPTVTGQSVGDLLARASP